MNEQIEARQTALPLQVEPGASLALNLFFPIAPSPLEVRVDYADSSGEHVIVLDTREAMNGLHLQASARDCGRLSRWRATIEAGGAL